MLPAFYIRVISIHFQIGELFGKWNTDNTDRTDIHGCFYLY
jgi:hypothetical protein